MQAATRLGGFLVLALALVGGLPAGVLAQERDEDAISGVPFKEGDVLGFAQLDKLKSFLPKEFWDNRDYFFYEGMSLAVGPMFRAYPEAAAFRQATKDNEGKASVGKDGALVGYRGGLPFTKIDCKGDPEAGKKLIWDFVKRWEGDGSDASWSYTYWDRGEQLPLFFEGTAKFIGMKYRVEPEFNATDGDLFGNEKRAAVSGIEVEAPFDSRGIQVLTYRYASSDGPLAEAKNDDTWVYVPDLRRVRRISTAQRTDSVQGTDFTRDDLRSFDGVPPQYEWECLGEADVIAPFRTTKLAYPYTGDYNFGPYGFSYASDNWELRHAWIIRFTPKNEDHPYDHKDIYLDKDTLEPLYSFAYDRKKELWKIIWHNHRYSQDKLADPRGKEITGSWYEGWEGVDSPDDLRVISDIIVNVQTGTGNRIEFWNNHGTPLSSKGKIRRYIDLGRLNKGR